MTHTLSPAHLQSHLRRSVLSDRHAHMRAHTLQVGERDGTHADLVAGAREERGKGAGEGDGAAATLRPNSHTDQVLQFGILKKKTKFKDQRV